MISSTSIFSPSRVNIFSSQIIEGSRRKERTENVMCLCERKKNAFCVRFVSAEANDRRLLLGSNRWAMESFARVLKVKPYSRRKLAGRLDELLDLLYASGAEIRLS